MSLNEKKKNSSGRRERKDEYERFKKRGDL